MYINEVSFRQWWNVFRQGDNELTEIRLLGKGGRTASGYFKDCDKALAALRRYPYEMGAYAPLNRIASACFSRTQSNMIVDGAKNTTSGSDIILRTWLLIDLDPKRPTDTNSNDAELASAKALMTKVGVFLKEQGFTEPVVAMSGNGYHLYYRVCMRNEDENTQLVKNLLSYLDMRFANDKCDIDLKVCDPNRIAKIIGTKSNKGADTPERPQRESYFLRARLSDDVTSVETIYKVVSMMPQAEDPTQRLGNGMRTTFNLDDFIRRHGIRVRSIQPFKSGVKYILEECPFDASHKAPDAAIFVMNSGAIGFFCFHNSCAGKTWRDVRLLYEPDAYDYPNRYYVPQEVRPVQTQSLFKVEETKPKRARWLRMSDIAYVDPDLFHYIKTGFNDLDRKVGGLCYGDITVLMGRAGAGKSTMIQTIVANAVEGGERVGWWTGELQDYRLQSWFDQTLAGPGIVLPTPGRENWYYCPRPTADRIHKWLADKVLLRNNEYGNKWGELFADIKRCVEENGTRLIILDNLTALDLDTYSGERNDKQSAFINDLRNFTKSCEIHVILVIHPRKEYGNALIRMESASGISDLTSLVDNVFLLHRTGDDFRRRAQEFFGKEHTEQLMLYGNVLEVAKNRSHGVVDTKIGLFFSIESRRFCNTMEETTAWGCVKYGWMTDEERRSPYTYKSDAASTDDDPFGPERELDF